LDKQSFSDTEEVEPKVNFYNDANKEVAILCNHQKTVSKSFLTQSEKMQEIVIFWFKLLAQRTFRLFDWVTKSCKIVWNKKQKKAKTRRWEIS